MKLTKRQETEVLQAYEAYFNSYIKGDVKTIASLLDEDYNQIGSAETEVFFNKKDALKFIDETIDQVAGKTEIRNRMLQVDPLGDFMLVTDLFDIYALIETEWTFYSRFRASTLMQKKEDGWKFIHQHSSMPDTRTQEGENIAIEKISAENLQLREAVKRRTVELEQKNRDLEIEAALERVRARTMAMHSSNELLDAAALLFEQIKELGCHPFSCGFVLLDKNKPDGEFWMSAEGKFQPSNLIPNSEESAERNMYLNWIKGVKIYTEEAGGEDLKAHFEYLMSLPGETGQMFQNMKDTGIEFPKWQKWHAAYFSQGYLLFITKEPFKETNLFLRFASVFEQTYTRFLDLQKAEKQARKAEVELALERVRARTMAMQKSEELADVSMVLFQQVEKLGIKTWATGFNIWLEGDTSYIDWVVNSSTGQFMEPYTVDLTTHPFFLEISKAKKRGDDFFVIEAGGRELEEHYRLLFKMAKIQFEHILESGFHFPEHQINHYVFGPKVSLMFITFEPCPDAHDIFKRFGKVFEQTYTRFLDLKKAEEQVREAQLEAALERVRSRSMAMHKSDEIAEVASVLFHQLQQLNIPALRRCLIGIVDETSATLHSWYTSMQGDSSHRIITYPIRGHPVIEAKIKGWRQQKPFSIELSGDELEDLLQYSVSHGFEYPKGEVAATHMVQNHAPFTYGYLEVATHGPISDQDFELLQRFARVFEQTYTRFLDLQKAEALAREAEIQLVLERIRARTMAMHRSEELAETAAVLFQQFNELGVTPERMNIGIMKEDEKIIEFWSTEQGGKKINQLFKTSIEERTTISKLYKAWKSGKKSMVIELSGRELGDWLHYLKNEIGLPFRVELVQDKRYHSTAFFTHGMLLMSTPEPLATETLSLLPRFANVFEQTYTRFLDLQKAEAQVREAQIEAGLERVRAKSMAMHHTSELQEVVNTVAEQLQLLEMDINGGVFITINKEVDEDLCFWGSFGVASSYVQKTCIPFLDRPIITVLRDAIKKGNGFYVEEYTRQEKMEFFKYLFKHPPFNSISEARKKELLSREGGYARSIAVSHYTSIFMINDYGKRFSDGDNDILKRFGKVFEQSYVRFLDLQKAEAQAREAQIEAALERVRAQSMAMHLSQDLQLVVNTVIKQLQKLKITLDTTNIIIFNRDDRTCNFWTGSNSTGKLLVSSWEVPYIDYLWLKDIAHAFETGQEVFTSCYSGDQKKTIFDYLLTSSGFKDLPDDRKKFILDSPVFTPMAAIVKDIAIQVVSYSRKTFFPEEIEIIKRFAKVFEQTYTRFLDLQKAEAREKEAIKQSSLDRVRAEIASMRTTGDLNRITPLIWRELTTLGVPFFRCGVFILNDENEKISVYLSTPSGEPLAAWHSDYDALPLFKATVGHWKKQKVYREEWDKKQFMKFTKSLIDQGMIDSPTRYQAGKDAPEYLALQMIPFEQGMFYVGSAEKLDEEQVSMVRALADAFSVAYARYEDFRKLEEAKGRVENTLTELKAAQTQLIHAEKMASLGELTAGIAHEIQNPLNFVNNFSEVSVDLIEDMEEGMINGNIEEAKAITEDLRQNLEKINHHGKRASDIVKGMLQHSRTSSGQKESTDINLLADEYLRLAYHGLRAKDKSFNSDFKTDLDETLPKIKVIPQEIGRVLLNLINNAFYAVSEKQKIAKKDYKPIVTLTTRRTSPLPTGQAGTGGPAPPKGGGQGEENVQISIKDNGPGIPEPIQDKIFQPFFTTKPTGQGTGLGLSLSYDIITKGHHGTLEVETQEGYGTEFIIALPIN